MNSNNSGWRKSAFNCSHSISAILFLLLFGRAMLGYGQDVRIPFDSDSTLYTITANMQADYQFGFLEQYPTLESAALYRLQGGDIELVIEYRVEARMARNRADLTPARLEEIRSEVDKVMQQKADEPDRDDGGDGSTRLYVNTTTLGVVSGSLITSSLGLSGGAAAGMPLIGGSAGFFGPFLSLRKEYVSEASARLTGYGGFQGYFSGLALSTVTGISDVSYDLSTSLSTISLGAGAYMGFHFSRSRKLGLGQAQMLKFNGLAGMFYGASLAGLILGENSYDYEKISAALSLAGTYGGLWLGKRLGDRYQYTGGDARVYFLSGLMGTQVAALVPVWTETGSIRLVTAALMGGSSLGFYLGHKVAARYNISESDGRIAGLGYASGYLFGGGISLVSEMDFKGYFTTSTAASLIAYLFTLKMITSEDNAVSSLLPQKIDSDGGWMSKVSVRPSIWNASMSTAGDYGRVNNRTALPKSLNRSIPVMSINIGL